MAVEVNPLELEYRMYFLVPYNISPIQQAIQAGHAAMEYALLNWELPEFQKWAKNDKTFIILNGGTFNDSEIESCAGTMNKALKTLLKEGIRVATFREPDLNNGLSAIAFLVDERVFNKEKHPYPAAIDIDVNNGAHVVSVRTDYQLPPEHWTHIQLQAIAGGYQNAFLRGFLQGYRLA